MKKELTQIAALAAALLLGPQVQPASAASIFLTGHDPDFHAARGGDELGAQHINQIAIGFVTDPGFNVFSLVGVEKFLFVNSSITPPGGHIDGENGIIASGFVEGTDYDRVDAGGLNAALDRLGTTYHAIVVASDFGGILTQAELDILNDRAADIATFLNAGGGLYAMAERGAPFGLTTAGDGQFGYLPLEVPSAPVNQFEPGFTVTPYGASLGLTDSDVNGNASHNIFTDTAGLNVVDVDAQGRIITLAGRTPLVPHTLRFYLHGHDIPGTAGGYTMNQDPAPSHVLTLNLLTAPRWFSEPTLTGAFLQGASFKLKINQTLGLNLPVTFRLSATNPNGSGEQELGQTTQLLGLAIGPKTVAIPVATPVTLKNKRLKLTISSALNVSLNLRLGTTYLEATKFVGLP
ncbi:MAG: hypothetical protein L0Z50_37135 [Verrucomicrobiales bacterium]|nr:hypothetical protein [Verrucomicrobiales bacterium]